MRQLEPDVQKYFDQFDGEALDRLYAVRALVLELAPDAEEGIRYGIPTFMLHGNLVHYAAFKKHIGFYPVPSGVEAFKDELAPYKQGKGSIQFPHDRPLPLDLMRRMVGFRIEENAAKAPGRKR